MAMRRPRIKVQANIALNSKRKPKVADVKTENASTRNETCPSESSKGTTEDEVKLAKEPEKTQDTTAKVNESSLDGLGVGQENATAEKEVNSADSIIDAIDTTANDKSHNDKPEAENDAQSTTKGNEDSINSPKTGNASNNNTQKDERNDSSTFKCPPKVGYQRSTSHTSNNNGTDDVFYSDIEENALQMDLQKTNNDFPMSPSKSQQSRQRIKATPVFGQRRNSFVGSSPSPHTATANDENPSGEFQMPTPRRERHLSGSMSTHSNSSSSHNYHHTPHKYLPNGVMSAGMARVRTESGCSVFSDSNVSLHKSRRADEHKLNLKREFEARFSNGVPDKSALKMSDLIFYNPSTNPMEQKPNPNIKLESGDKNPGEDMKKEGNDADKNDAEKEDAMPVPQLKLNSNGELILDDKSLVIETTAEQEARKVLANSSLIYLDENTGMNGFYSRQKRTRDWPPAETVKFYRCLQTVGTDFSLMVPLFPNRSRRDLKLKFKKEERINGSLINKALLYPKNFDIEELKKLIEEEEKQREEETERLRQLRESASKSVRKRKNARSHADRTLKAGEIYQNENKPVPKKPRRSNKSNNGQPNQVITPTQTETPPSQAATEDQLSHNHATTSATISHTSTSKEDQTISHDIKTEGDKVRRRRRRGPNIKKEKASVLPQHNGVDEVVQLPEDHDINTSSIKLENVKNEPIHMSLYATKTEYCNEDDDEQIEKDVNLLLHSDMNEEDELPSTSHGSPIRRALTVPITESPDSSSSNSRCLVIDDNYCDEPMDIDLPYEGRTFVNLDDGSFTTLDTRRSPASPQNYENETSIISQPTPSPSPPTTTQLPHPLSQPPPQSPQQNYHPSQSPRNSNTLGPASPDLACQDTSSSFTTDRELNEQDIQRILTELAEGSLVLVSTLDPDDPDKVLNEIFMVDKNTGDLCDEPLNIPDNIVQCILSVMS